MESAEIIRLAKALVEYDKSCVAGGLHGYDDFTAREQRFYHGRARAILEALREPTAEMTEAMRLCTIRNSRPVDPARPFESPFTCAVDTLLA